MLGHNNTYERNRKYSDKYQRFTICRLGLVTVSVLIGLTFATGQLVHADTTVTATELATTISGDVVENSESPPVEGERLEKVTDVSPSVTNQEDNGEGKKETLKQTTDEKEGVSPTGSAIVEEIPVMTNQIKTTDVEKIATPDKQFLQQNTTTQSRVDQEPKVQQRLMQAQVQQRTVVPRFELSDWIYNVYDQNKIIILKQYIGYGKEVTIKGHPDGKYSDYRIEIPNFSWDFWGATRALYITKISFLSAADGTKVKFTGRHLSLDGKKEGNHSFFDELSEIDFSGLDTQSVTDMSYFLAGNLSLNKINLAGLDTRRVTNMANAFMDVGRNYRNYYEDKTIEYLDLSSFDTHNVTNMSGMFMGAKTKHLNISSFNTSKVTSMREMFSGMYTLEELDVSHFDTRSVTDMQGMFETLSSINKLDVSHFDTRKVTNMDYMFKGLGVAKLDISRFDTRNVISMSYIFAGMKNIDYIDLRNFNTSKVTNMAGMFAYSSLKK